MAANPTATSLDIPPPPSLGIDWPRARRSLRELLDDPEDTARAFDLIYAIGRREFERDFQRFAASPTGRRLTLERSSLADALADRAALAALPADSLGGRYQAYLDENGFEATGLIALRHGVEERWSREDGVPALDPLRRFYSDRLTLAHDLSHVVTDYGTDDLGEATLLAFWLGQSMGRANTLLTVGAAVEVARNIGFRGWIAYDLRAFRRGRRAAWLPAVPWEELLPLRLETVQRLLRLEPGEEAHPGGVMRQTFHEAPRDAA